MHMKLQIFSLALVFLCSCGVSNQPTPEKQAEKLTSFELYLFRSNMLDAPGFEQYTLQGEDLFYECGQVRRGRHLAETQDLKKLNQNEVNSLSSSAKELAANYSKDDKFEQPGGKNHFFDHGALTLQLSVPTKEVEIKTSLDSIATPSNQREKMVQRFVESVRGVAGSVCGNNEFFGLGKRG